MHILKVQNYSTKFEEGVMAITKMFENATQYISEAVARIFGLNDDKYPMTGVQPFDGDPYKERPGSDW